MSDPEPNFSDKLEEILKRIRKATSHKSIRLTNRGNSAIFAALSIAKRVNSRPYILIPDQGGWLSYRKYPQYFNFAVKEVQTEYGVIDIEQLEEHTKTASALIINSFAGYFAEQPLKAIAKICHKNGCMLIEDATSAFGDKNLCNGKYSDIIVGSFGQGSSVNFKYGGFLSTAKPEHADASRDALSLVKVHESFYREILPYLNNKRLLKILFAADSLKKQLEAFEVLHRGRRGLDVVVKFSPDIVSFCQQKKLPYTLCPDYNRVNEKALCIEVKDLPFEETRKE